jgi:hypothetical protein
MRASTRLPCFVSTSAVIPQPHAISGSQQQPVSATIDRRPTRRF